MEDPRFYLVIDLEATCDAQQKLRRGETEVIEVGAVLLDAELRPVSELQTFVRPVLHPRLTRFCIELTSIQQRDVDEAPSFPEAMKLLSSWLAEAGALGRLLFCSWGDYDRAQLGREQERHGLRLPLGQGHLNLKEAFREHDAEQKKLGVGEALARVGLSFEGTAHRGIDDARNIARLLPYCLGRTPIP